MLKLEKFPKRCSLALESQYLDIEVRQLFYQNQYKILLIRLRLLFLGGKAS